MVLKTSGLGDVLRTALAPLSGDIPAAFVYGSVAKREDTATSDIDLMVVSDRLTYADLSAVLEEATGRLGRKVNPTVYAPAELARRIRQGNAFVRRVLAQPKIWLIGGERDLASARLKRLPYGLYFVWNETPAATRVIACIHAQRDSRRWLRRA